MQELGASELLNEYLDKKSSVINISESYGILHLQKTFFLVGYVDIN